MNQSGLTKFPARLLTGALVLTGVVLVSLVWFTFDSYRSATTAQLRNLRIEELSGTIMRLDEVLTMSAHMAVATGDSDWERRYRQFEPQLNAAIKEAMRLADHSVSAEGAAQTDAANLKLVEMENRSFVLVRAGKAGQARAILFADAYEAQKKIYARGMVTLIQHLKEQLTANQRKKRREAFLSIVAIAFCMVLLLSTWLSALRRVNYWRTRQSASLVALTRAEGALREVNDGLEKRVEGRTAELANTNAALQQENLQRKQAEETLRRTEELYRRAIAGADAVPYAYDYKTRTYLFMGEGIERLTGYAPQEVTPALWKQIIQEDVMFGETAGMDKGEAADRVRTGELRNWRCDMRVITRDGQTRWLSDKSVQTLDESGRPTGSMGILQDITERKRVEETLAQQGKLATLGAEIGVALARQENLRDILKQCTESMVRHFGAAFARIWTLNSQDSVLELQASAGMYTHLDGPHGRVPVGKLKIGLIAQERRPHLTNAVVGDPRVGDQEWAKREGMVSFAGYPLVAGGQVVGVMAMFSRHPLAETTLQALAAIADRIALSIVRKQTEESLRLLSSAIEHSGDTVLIAARDGVIEYVNPAFLRLTGYEKAEVLGQAPRILKSGHHPQEFYQNLWTTILSGQSFRAEFTNRKKNGELYSEEKTITPVLNAAGVITHFVATGRDVTERKNQEAKMDSLHKQLQEVSRQAGMAEVASNVLHNVGNVLNSVNVSTALLAEKIKTSKVSSVGKAADLLAEHADDLHAFLTADPRGARLPTFLRDLGQHLLGEQQAILREARLLAQNIEHIKEIVAMQQSYAKISGVAETVSITDLVEDALRMNEGAFSRHEVRVVREFADVPLITTEKHKVLQVLVNLMRNAKYALDEGGRPEKLMRVRVERNGHGTVRISVIDDGVGIPPENLTRIFEHGFTTRKTGHGFGLHSGALAARELGGNLKAQSDGPGRGAAFTLELPASRPGHDL